MSRAQECINQVLEMITTQGVEAAKKFALDTTITLEQDGVVQSTTVFQLMKNNAQKREKELDKIIQYGKK